ncbi:MAG: DnaJ domain-containing protein [Candidatus Velthaea sp.]
MIHSGNSEQRSDGQRGQIRALAADYYDVLGVARSASPATIKFAYRQLARKHHPDVSEDQASAEHKLREINEAYNVLSDRRKRANYDRFGNAAATVGGAETMARVFDMFFGAARKGAGESPGKDLHCDADATAEELAAGTDREISFRHLVACEACSGSGADPGTPVSVCERCSGSGTMRQVRQTPRSVHLTQTTCSLCNGEGQIVATPCRVCGGRGGIESEKAVMVTIPPGTPDGTVIKIEGGGAAGLRGGRDGDLYVRVAVASNEPSASDTPLPSDAGPATPAPLSSTIRWQWIVAIVLLALVPSAGIVYAVDHRAAVKPANAAVTVCAMPSAERLATDLVRGYRLGALKTPQRLFVTGTDGDNCDVRFSFAPGNLKAAVARDGIVAIVNPLNPISRISEAQLRAIFSGTIRDWSELGGPPGAIVPILPNAASDEAHAIEAALFSGLSIDRSVIRRPTIADVTRTVAGAGRISRTAIGLVPYSQAIPAKMIPLAYLPPPNVLTIASQHYPLTLTIALQSESQHDGAAAQPLIDFALSRDGQAIVEKNGLIPPEGF